MSRRLRIDGVEFDPAQLSPEAKTQVRLIRFADEKLKELTNMQALLTRAKRSYIDGLEREIIKARSGVDFTTLLSD